MTPPKAQSWQHTDSCSPHSSSLYFSLLAIMPKSSKQRLLNKEGVASMCLRSSFYVLFMLDNVGYNRIGNSNWLQPPLWLNSDGEVGTKQASNEESAFLDSVQQQ